jgi:hypothetical protein
MALSAVGCRLSVVGNQAHQDYRENPKYFLLRGLVCSLER